MERSAADSWEDKADNSSSATTPEEEDSMEIDEDGTTRPKVYKSGEGGNIGLFITLVPTVL